MATKDQVQSHGFCCSKTIRANGELGTLIISVMIIIWGHAEATPVCKWISRSFSLTSQELKPVLGHPVRLVAWELIRRRWRP